MTLESKIIVYINQLIRFLILINKILKNATDTHTHTHTHTCTHARAHKRTHTEQAGLQTQLTPHSQDAVMTGKNISQVNNNSYVKKSLGNTI